MLGMENAAVVAMAQAVGVCSSDFLLSSLPCPRSQDNGQYGNRELLWI